MISKGNLNIIDILFMFCLQHGTIDILFCNLIDLIDININKV
jgi:hypothetical protein